VLLAMLLAAACGRERPETVSLWLGGDVHLGDSQADILAPLEETLGELGGVGIVNLEGPVGPGPSSVERLVNSAAALPVLTRHGVVVAGVANNHARDLGPRGAEDTRSALLAAGIEPAGMDRVAMIRRGGLRIAVTAHEAPSPASSPALRAIASAVLEARNRADLVVATFHVTGPPSYLPRPELVAAVDAALHAGARIVVAHGTHALARVERRGDAVIAWGLGNLAFACECTNERDALLLRVELTREGIHTATVIPIQAGLHGAPARLASEPDLIFDLLESLGSSPLRRDGARAHLR
jgi:poly-gamma-glutamate capsule biosynthesis protein CapA/YwtB (metallophosphatase superfamily)